MGALQNYFAAVAKAYPKQFGPTWKNIIAENPTPMDDLRSQIWRMRFEYWFRKVGSMGSTWSGAKSQLCDVRSALSNPGQITYKQMGHAFVWSVQIAGCFALGEMHGRGSIGGYRVGEWWGNKEEAHH